VPTDEYVSIVEDTHKKDETTEEQSLQIIQRSPVEITLFLYDEEFKPAPDGNFHRHEFIQGAKWYLSNLFKILHEQVRS
jgi:hypothetical protein